MGLYNVGVLGWRTGGRLRFILLGLWFGALILSLGCGPKISEAATQVSPEDIQVLVDSSYDADRVGLKDDQLFLVWTGTGEREALPSVYLSTTLLDEGSAVETQRLSSQGLGGLAPTMRVAGAGVEVAWLERSQSGKDARYALRLAKVEDGVAIDRTPAIDWVSKERHPVRFLETTRGVFLSGITKNGDERTWRQRLLRRSDQGDWLPVELPGRGESGPRVGQMHESETGLFFCWLSGGRLALARSADGQTWNSAESPGGSKAESVAWGGIRPAGHQLLWAERDGMRSVLKISTLEESGASWSSPRELHSMDGTGVDFLTISAADERSEVLLQLREAKTGCKSVVWFTFSESDLSAFERLTTELCRASQNAFAASTYNGVVVAWPQVGGDSSGIQVVARGSELGSWEPLPDLLLRNPETAEFEAPLLITHGRDGYLIYIASEKKAGLAGMFGRTDQRLLYVRKVESLMPFSLF